MRGNNMTCDNKNCNCNEEEDDFEIQRLQDIITICEFLIKHKRNQKHRDALDEILDSLKDDIDDSKDDDKTITTKRVVYQPIWYPNVTRTSPYLWWDNYWHIT
jgi:hypothetical protein